MKAREFLVRRRGEDGVKLRHLLKEELDAGEIRRLAAMAGGPEQLVAPKRRAEAEGLSGEKLIAGLAEDGGRIRRPIVIVGKKITLGFNAAAQAELEALVQAASERTGDRQPATGNRQRSASDPSIGSMIARRR